jgi:hypothetical protein
VGDRADVDLDGLADERVVGTRRRSLGDAAGGHGFLRGVRGPRRILLA